MRTLFAYFIPQSIQLYLGYWLEEVAAPYNTFTDAGFDVDIASISGGLPPVDEGSLTDSSLTDDTKRFSNDAVANAKLAATKSIDDFVRSATEYSAVFLPGGHGTVIDCPGSAGLKAVVEAVYSAGIMMINI
jgi:putative intracellular protease/amidase